MVQIEILNGPEVGRILPLSDGSFTVGRASACDLVVPGDAVSGRHLELAVEGSVVKFRDLESTNGTFLDGIQVQEGDWEAGAELRIGSVRMVLASDSKTEVDSDAAIHRRAVADALHAGPRRRLSAVLLALILVAGASTAVVLLWPEPEPEPIPSSVRAEVGSTDPVEDELPVEPWVASVHGDYSIRTRSGEIAVALRGQPVWEARGEGLAISTGSDGVVLAGPECTLTIGESVAASGPLLMLAEGGAVEVAPGVKLSASPGLLLGGSTRRCYFRFESPRPIEVLADGRVRLSNGGPIRAPLSLQPLLEESARVYRDLQSAVQQKDGPAILTISAILLRDFPLEQLQVDFAHNARDSHMAASRIRYQELFSRAAEAFYLGSRQELDRVSSLARTEALSVPGTDLATSLTQLADSTMSRAAEILAAEQEAKRAYYGTLASALHSVYPFLADYVASSGGGR